MSAEGKKKRGESGKSNAKNIAFRYGGKPCDYSTRVGATRHPRLAGARLLHAMELAALLPGFSPSERLVKATDETIEHIGSLHRDTTTARAWSEAAE